MSRSLVARGNPLSIVYMHSASGGMQGVSPSPEPEPAVDRIVTNRCRIAQQLSETGYIRYECRIRINTYAAATDCKMVFPSYWLNSGTVTETVAPFTITAAIEKDGVNTPVTFNGGAPSVLMTPGAGLIVSDSFGALDGNSVYFFRCGAELGSTSESIPTGSSYRLPVNDNNIEQTIRSNSASVVGGVGPMPGSYTSNGGYGPVAIIGKTATVQPSCLILGDSIVQTLDGTGDVHGNVGWIARGLHNESVPYAMASRGGNRASRSTQALAPAQFLLAQWATHVVMNIGRNDIGISSLATLQADISSMIAGCKAHGCKVYLAPVCPSTDSGNGWIDEAGQSFKANFGPGGVRSQINAWMVARVVDGAIDGLVDPMPVLESAITPGMWLTTGLLATRTTYDGTHPGVGAGDATIHAAMSPYMATVAAGW